MSRTIATRLPDDSFHGCFKSCSINFALQAAIHMSTPSAPGEEQTSWVMEREEAATIPGLEKDIRFSNVKRSLNKCAVNSVYAAPLTTAYCQFGAILIARTQLALVRFRLDQTTFYLCRSRYRCHGFLGLPHCRSKTTMDLGATLYFGCSRGKPSSEKSPGLGNAVSTILRQSCAVPSWI